jgi:hypothetical protein
MVLNEDLSMWRQMMMMMMMMMFGSFLFENARPSARNVIQLGG